MNKFLAVVLVVATALLATLVYEVHTLNRRLAPATGLAADFARELAATDTRSESPTERERRLDAAAREQHDSVRDALEVLKRSLALDEDRPAARRSKPDAARRPSADTP